VAAFGAGGVEGIAAVTSSVMAGPLVGGHRPKGSATEAMKIAIVHASDAGGGAERSVITLHRGLRNLGHESTLYVGSCSTNEPGVVEIPYVRGLPGTRRLARSLERVMGWQDIYNPSFRALADLIPTDTDVIHFNSLWGAGGFADLSALPALTAKIPGVITLRENWLLTGHCACFFDCERWKIGCGQCPDLTIAPAIARDGTAFNYRRKQRAIQGARLDVVTISDWLKERAAESSIMADKRLHRIYNGIDLETFRPAAPAERGGIREELGIDSNQMVVFLAGQTVEGIKRSIATQFAVDAINASKAKNLFALVVGHSSERVRAMLACPGTAVPFVTEPAGMARLYQAADLTLVTSEAEAFGRIAAESQACGTPVISFDTGGLPEVVADGVGGLVVPKGDGVALLAALDRLVGDVDLLQSMVGLGLDYVVENFDQQHVAAQYAALYQQVAIRYAS